MTTNGQNLTQFYTVMLVGFVSETKSACLTLNFDLDL